MTGRFTIRPRARKDLFEIADHIARDNLEAADRFLDAVATAFERLSTMPRLGSARRFRRESLRDIRL